MAAEIPTDPKAMQAKIQETADRIGWRMQSMLPFQSAGWLARSFGMFQDTNRARIPTETEDTFLQVWLERKGAKVEADAPVRLLSTTVELGDIDSGRADVMTGEAIASYGTEGGFDLPQPLGTPQDETLERLYELDGFVTAIAKIQPPRGTHGGVQHTVAG